MSVTRTTPNLKLESNERWIAKSIIRYLLAVHPRIAQVPLGFTAAVLQKALLDGSLSKLDKEHIVKIRHDNGKESFVTVDPQLEQGRLSFKEPSEINSATLVEVEESEATQAVDLIGVLSNFVKRISNQKDRHVLKPIVKRLGRINKERGAIQLALDEFINITMVVPSDRLNSAFDRHVTTLQNSFLRFMETGERVSCALAMSIQFKQISKRFKIGQRMYNLQQFNAFVNSSEGLDSLCEIATKMQEQADTIRESAHLAKTADEFYDAIFLSSQYYFAAFRSFKGQDERLTEITEEMSIRTSDSLNVPVYMALFPETLSVICERIDEKRDKGTLEQYQHEMTVEKFRYPPQWIDYLFGKCREDLDPGDLSQCEQIMPTCRFPATF